MAEDPSDTVTDPYADTHRHLRSPSVLHHEHRAVSAKELEAKDGQFVRCQEFRASAGCGDQLLGWLA